MLAAFTARTGDPEAAAELIGAAAAERERPGAQRMPDERPIFEATVRELETPSEPTVSRARGSGATSGRWTRGSQRGSPRPSVSLLAEEKLLRYETAAEGLARPFA